MNTKLIIFSLLLLASLQCTAQNINASETTINNYMQSKSSIDEGAESQGFVLYDFDEDNVPEIVVVWLLRGATYWTSHLSVLKAHGNRYSEIATLQLIGAAKLKEIMKDRILVEQMVYSPSDPICCPSIEKVMRYEFRNNKIYAAAK